MLGDPYEDEPIQVVDNPTLKKLPKTMKEDEMDINTFMKAIKEAKLSGDQFKTLLQNVKPMDLYTTQKDTYEPSDLNKPLKEIYVENPKKMDIENIDTNSLPNKKKLTKLAKNLDIKVTEDQSTKPKSGKYYHKKKKYKKLLLDVMGLLNKERKKRKILKQKMFDEPKKTTGGNIEQFNQLMKMLKQRGGN